MNEFTTYIAERFVGAQAQFESTWDYCSQYLTGETPEFTVRVEPQDIALEREKSLREDALEGLSPRTYSDAYLEITALQRKITEQLFDYDTLLLHGSAIAVDGAAYLFTAKSGTGKSTHTRLWRELLGEKAVMVNDDKPFIRITDEGAVACGSPWNGKHRLGNNIQVPLKAICILNRGNENRIRKITSGEAVFMLLQQSSRPMDPGKMPKYMELLDKLAACVTFYEMECTQEPAAAEVAYTAMSGKQRADVGIGPYGNSAPAVRRSE